MKRRFEIIFALLLLTLGSRLSATHIAGAELTYECLGNDQYRVRLTFFRDCLNGSTGAPFDNPLELFVFQSSTGNQYNTWQVNAPFNTPQIQLDNWDACLAILPNFCVEVGVYETVITLPAVTGGYDIAWTRCCRNVVISNLAQPGCEGVTFLAHVPGPDEAVCNSMPTFNQRPSLFLCAGQTYYFDNSATDIDGDSLVYEIANPYTGLNFQGLGTANSSGQCGPGLPDPVASQFNPMGPPPYQNVVFGNGYSFLNPFGPGSNISINPGTGYLEAFPANPGIYVVVVSVKEYRDGILLSENKRDFQFHVVPCLPQGPAPVLTHDLSGLNVVGDTILAEAGKPFCYDFVIEDTVLPSTLIVTPLSTSFGGNGGFPPPYATITTNGNTPPVEGQICWRPSCEYVGNVVPMIISARDTNDCPNYNIVFDTIWVRVIPSPGFPPLVQNDLSQAPSVGDTIMVDVGEPFCYNFIVADTVGGGSLTAGNVLLNAPNVPISPVVTLSPNTAGDTIFGQVCWEGVCDSVGLYALAAVGIDEYQCPPENEARDTVWVRVRQPENPAPVLSTDISQNPVIVADTIVARVHENFCFNFTVEDTSLTSGDSLGFQYYLQDLQGGFVFGNVPTYSVSGVPDSIGGVICWTPGCEHVGDVFRFLVQGIQINDCNNRNYDHDTVYVRVIEPFKPAPVISHDLGPDFPANDVVMVEDADTFCFTFRLLDTVTPTRLSYLMEVFYEDGSPFAGVMPTLTYDQYLDSLITGEICWTVPCELAGQNFKIRMTGRDTFDCRVSNTVYDSVRVVHTENDPAAVDLCRVSVMPGDASMEVSWETGTEKDGAGYVVARRRSDETSFTVLDTLYSYADSAYLDNSFLVADEYSYCYQVQAMDRCGNLSEPSSEMCSILLKGAPNGYTSELSWSPYRGWPFGVDQYAVYRDDFTDLAPAELLVDLGPNTYSHLDRTITAARTCYRIEALEFSGGCGGNSWSNEICLDFPPTLYVPTAFSPNGDGLNDIFTSAGEFVRDFDLVIYDRWGKLLFHTSDVVQGWDGTINGKPCQEGVYLFKMMVVGYDEQVLQRNGSVTLIR